MVKYFLFKVKFLLTQSDTLLTMANIQRVLGNNVRRLRNRNGWSQIFLADRLDVSVSFISIIESGQRGVSLQLIEEIANVFEVPVPYLFTDHEAEKNPQKNIDDSELIELHNDLKEGLSDYIDAFFVRRKNKG